MNVERGGGIHGEGGFMEKGYASDHYTYYTFYLVCVITSRHDWRATAETTKQAAWNMSCMHEVCVCVCVCVCVHTGACMCI